MTCVTIQFKFPLRACARKLSIMDLVSYFALMPPDKRAFSIRSTTRPAQTKALSCNPMKDLCHK